MKNISIIFVSLALLFSMGSCAPKGTVIDGEITGAGNLQAFLDEVIIGKASTILAKADIASDGSFRISMPEGVEPGVYNLRIGAMRINLILSGEEKKVVIKGDLNTLPNYEVEIQGSPDSEIFAATMRALIQQRMSAADVSKLVDTVRNPITGAFVAFRAMGTAGEFLEIQKKAQARLQGSYPNLELTTAYAEFLAMVEQQYQAQMAQELVRIGADAPDISLPSPSGRKYKLSDLKGKVVLLDFWASWCGPCRRENPNVVSVYNKYKDKGFTIFSVSLDGVDESIRQRLASPQELQNVLNTTRQQWTQAIKDDNLSWEYHVSDLRRWDSAAADMYGVRGIPRAFMINREGKIVATEVRGAAMIEQELLKHL
jgi:thiol-disulfide isomerase/thioredoxin